LDGGEVLEVEAGEEEAVEEGEVLEEMMGVFTLNKPTDGSGAAFARANPESK
jgi:hypothetical protein